MLPDLPELKRQIRRALEARMRATMKARLGPPFAQVRRRLIEEGDSTSIVYPDGSIRGSEMHELVGEFAVDNEVLRKGDLATMLQELDKAAEQMAEQQAKYTFETLKQVSEEAGTAVDQEGRPLTAEAILAVLEKIELDFTGGRFNLQLVVSPKLRPQAEKALQVIESDPTLKNRWETLMTRKKEEFRAREARRQLVD